MQEWPWEVSVISLAPLGTITAGWNWGGGLLCYPLPDNDFWDNNDINSVAECADVGMFRWVHNLTANHTLRAFE